MSLLVVLEVSAACSPAPVCDGPVAGDRVEACLGLDVMIIKPVKTTPGSVSKSMTVQQPLVVVAVKFIVSQPEVDDKRCFCCLGDVCVQDDAAGAFWRFINPRFQGLCWTTAVIYMSVLAVVNLRQ